MIRQLRIVFLLILVCFTKPLHAVAPITTQGNQVLIGGQQGSLAGNSFFWSNFGGSAYYNANVVRWLKQDWNTTIIRAAIGVEEFNGILSNPTLNRNALFALVDAAIDNDLYVIIDWHTHHAESNAQAAVNFFNEIAETYGNHENVIFEIYNEPIGDYNSAQATWTSIKNYAAPVIAAIREHSDNLIIVGTPFFSQRVDIASQSPITDVDNLAYTLHFYAGTHGQQLRDRAQTALNNGIPLFVTEWGTVNADGNGSVNESSTQQWMQFLQNNNISHLNWAVNDKAEGASVLIGTEQGANNQGNWPLSLLTPSGLLTREIIRGWPAVGGSNTPPPPPPEPTSTVVPGLIQAEDYDRQFGVQTEAALDQGGGLNIGFIAHNDYVEYDVNIRRTGSYNLAMRLASNTSGGSILLSIDDIQTTANLSVGFTGGWQTWTTVNSDIELPAGEHKLRFTFRNANANSDLMNVNWIDFQSNSADINFLLPIYDLLLNGSAPLIQ